MNRILEIFLKGCERFIIITKCIVEQDVIERKGKLDFWKSAGFGVVRFQTRQSISLRCVAITQMLSVTQRHRYYHQLLDGDIGQKGVIDVECERRMSRNGRNSAEAGAFSTLMLAVLWRGLAIVRHVFLSPKTI